MLSIVDLKKELGNNIYIYPVHRNSIKSNSIDLHVSEYAWSLNTKRSIGHKDYITIDPKDTALIYTEESIYVSNCIGGSYHSKVTLVSKGAGHIGTTLDAQYTGCSIIAFHNHSNEKIRLKVGSEFVTLQFWYLNTPDYKDTVSHDNEPGHPRMLNGFQDVDPYIEWRNNNTWTTKKKDLYLKMTESDEYKKCKEEYQKELDVFNRNIVKNRTKKYLLITLSMLVIGSLISLLAYYFNLGIITTVSKYLCEKLIPPIMVSVFSTFIILDIKNREKN